MPFDRYSTRNSEFPRPYSAYASRVITVSGSTTDYSLKDNTTLFDTLSTPVEVIMQNGNQNISFKFNSAANNTFPLSANGEFGVQNFLVTDIFVTVSGSSTASINIFTLGWK
jgi:hypothetical protein